MGRVAGGGSDPAQGEPDLVSLRRVQRLSPPPRVGLRSAVADGVGRDPDGLRLVGADEHEELASGTLEEEPQDGRHQGDEAEDEADDEQDHALVDVVDRVLEVVLRHVGADHEVGEHAHQQPQSGDACTGEDVVKHGISRS